MDLQQLRSWADVMDKALVISTVVAVLAIAAVGVSAFFSVRFAGALRTQEAAAFDRYKAEISRHATQLEADAVRAAERQALLEKTAADAERRVADVDGARARAAERISALEREALETRRQAAELERRLAERAVAAATAPPVPVPAPPTSPPTSTPTPAMAPRPDAQGLARFPGTRAAIYVVDEVADGTTVGASIESMLGEAGWAPLTWRWTGVGGIVGAVVLIREGSDAATEAAAQGLLEALQAAGFNVAKGHWPADWRRFKGNLHGPQSPAPTDAPIRIVIGNKAR